LYRAIDQFGQVIDVVVSEKRDMAATRRFFTRALEHGPCPTEVTTDRAAAYPRVLDELVPGACHITEQYATDEIVNPSQPVRSKRFRGFVLKLGPLARQQRRAAVGVVRPRRKEQGNGLLALPRGPVALTEIGRDEPLSRYS
jgi:hypothetical protein